jgi:hypothetical protein
VILQLFEKAFVSLVNRPIDIRIVRFWRSTNDVLTCFGSGVPAMICDVVPMHLAGL